MLNRRFFEKQRMAGKVASSLAIVVLIIGEISGRQVLNTEVEVKQGLLRGTIEQHSRGSYVSFKGIPYARPPLGHLRFAEPYPAEDWEGVRDASEHGDNCLQLDVLTETPKGSEDCLFVNMYTPNPKGKLSVMVFIHGGAFQYGSGDIDFYGPELLVQNDVVVATINYRLDALGFLTLDTAEASGNAGLKDQAAALRWLKENAASFGGDPDSITIFGESAGAASVIYHMFSRHSESLFHRAIAQSGVATSPWALDGYGLDKALRACRLLGFNGTDRGELLAALRQAPASDLVGIGDRIFPGDPLFRDIDFQFIPVIEKRHSIGNAFIEEPVHSLLAKNQFNDVPVIFGFTNGEGLVFFSQSYANEKKINEDFGSYINRLTRMILPKMAADEIKRFYFEGEDFSEDTEAAMVDLRTDTIFAYGTYDLVRALAARARSPVFFYVLSYLSELTVWGPIFGGKHSKLLAHGDDLGYLFLSPFNSDISDWSNDTVDFVRQFDKMWINMAKDGNPTPEDDDSLDYQWNPVEVNHFAYLDMDRKMKVKVDPLKNRMTFWDNFFDRHSDLVKCSYFPSKFSITKEFDKCYY